MALQALWYYLWIAPHLLLVMVLAVMIFRGLHRQFPIFFLYTISEIIQFVLLLFTVFHYRYADRFGGEYTIFYSSGLMLSTMLRFGVIYEILSQLLHSYPGLQNAGNLMLRSVALALLVLAVVGAIYIRGETPLSLLTQLEKALRNPERHAFDLLTSARETVNQIVSVLQSGLLVFIFLFSRYFTLSWRSPVFGIALGVGILASVEQILSAIRLGTHTPGNLVLSMVSMGTYHLCVLIWLFYFMASERPPKYNSTDLPKNDLETWNQELQKLTRK